MSKILTIKKEVQVGDIILEKGDKVRVFENRAGSNLSTEDKDRIEGAIKILQKEEK